MSRPYQSAFDSISQYRTAHPEAVPDWDSDLWVDAWREDPAGPFEEFLDACRFAWALTETGPRLPLCPVLDD